jgi:hypothetical protein
MAKKQPGYIFSQEIRNTPRMTSRIAVILRGVSRSTSFKNSADRGKIKRDDPLISGEIKETRSIPRAVYAKA